LNQTGYWTSGSPITIKVDGLPVGSYNYTIVVKDLINNSVIDSVSVIVVEPNPPTLTNPVDITYEEGVTGNIISWIAADSDPGTYVVYKNGTLNQTGYWTSGSPITIKVDGLPVGSYNYTIVFKDLDNNSVINTVYVNVIDTIAPSLTSPNDIIYEEGVLNNNIIWIASDFNPDTYHIYRNSTELETGLWISNSPLVINVDGLKTGSYNYMLEVKDSFNHSTFDVVIVTVINPTSPNPVITTNQEVEMKNDDKASNSNDGTENILISTLLLSNGTFFGYFILRRYKKQSNPKLNHNIETLFKQSTSSSQYLEETGINKQIEDLEQKIAKMKNEFS
ncbi:MAG: hypothetical protein ACFFAU_10645, partial [Candidatus Hodarchaeota archaeon]